MTEGARLRRRFVLAMAAWSCGPEPTKPNTPAPTSTTPASAAPAVVEAPAPTPASVSRIPNAGTTATAATVDPPPGPKPTGTLATRPPPGPLDPQLGTATYETTFPRPKGKEEWCSKEGTAVCISAQAGSDVASCPQQGKVDCNLQRVHKSWTPPPGGCFGTLLADVSKRERKSGHKDVCCYDVGERCGMPGEGRPLRASWDANAILAPTTHTDAWSMDLHGHAESDPLRAARWAEAARAEHASVAAFAKASLDLLAHGAPPELLLRAHQAAADEIVHARVSFALARRFSATDEPIGPAPLVMPTFATPSLVDFARETFRDGCIGESLAAERARRAALSATDEAERTALLLIAEDETRHAELAWSIVGWAATRDEEVRAMIDAEISLHAEARHRLAGLASA